MATLSSSSPACCSSSYAHANCDKLPYSVTTNMAPAEPNALPFQTKGQEPHFPEEIDGWKGYIEWEKYPEKRKEAEAILEKYDFPEVSTPVISLTWLPR